MSIDGEDFMSLGKLFHNFGAHTENALSPKVVVLDLVTLRRYWLLEHKFHWFLYGWINSLRYVGANPFKTLYIRSSILNLIRLCMVSQWRSFNIGVICSFILESVTTLAAVFCIGWRHSIWYKGRPNSKLLQLSRRELTNAWTRRSVVARSRCFLIFPMLRRANEALLQILLMWDLRFMCLSKKAPKSFTWPCGQNIKISRCLNFFTASPYIE